MPPYEKCLSAKTASLSGLLMGPIGHFATNLAGRAAHHGSNLGEMMAHKGFQHGAGGASIAGGALRSISALAGPEATATYHAARSLGEHLYTMPPQQREAAMRAIRTGAVSDNPRIAALQNSPLLGDILKAVRHDVEGTAPTPQANGIFSRGYSAAIRAMASPTTSQFDTPVRSALHNAAGLAPLAAFTGVDTLATGGAAPVGAAAHIGVNTARELLGRSRLGTEFTKSTLRQGLQGKAISPVKQLAWDIGASPAALDGYRVGKAVHQTGAGPHVLNTLERANWQTSRIPEAAHAQAQQYVNQVAPGVHIPPIPKRDPRVTSRIIDDAPSAGRIPAVAPQGPMPTVQSPPAAVPGM